MTLGLPWTARRSNQPILKEIDPEYSLEGLKLKPPDAKSRLMGKDPDENWGQEKEAPEEEMVR